MDYRNNRALAIEVYKVQSGMSPVIMNEIFKLREESHYNLGYTSNIPLVHSVYYGSQSVLYLERKLWDLISPVMQ